MKNKGPARPSPHVIEMGHSEMESSHGAGRSKDASGGWVDLDELWLGEARIRELLRRMRRTAQALR